MVSFCVYGLSDSRDPQVIRYVGKTKTEWLHRRLSQHISGSRRWEESGRPGKDMSYKKVWICEVLAKGGLILTTPLLIHLPSEPLAYDIEQRIIASFNKYLPGQLTNGVDGRIYENGLCISKPDMQGNKHAATHNEAQIENVFHLRANHCTQRTIAKQLGMTQQAVSLVLRGQRWPEVHDRMRDTYGGEGWWHEQA